MKSPLVRITLVTIGLLSLLAGVIGIFLPLLPTVPFLLLAAACFARSSERIHAWLIEHRCLGPMISAYMDGQGVPMRAKVAAISMLWTSIAVSSLVLIPLLWVKLLLIVIGLSVTLYLLSLPTRKG